MDGESGCATPVGVDGLLDVGSPGVVPVGLNGVVPSIGLTAVGCDAWLPVGAG